MSGSRDSRIVWCIVVVGALVAVVSCGEPGTDLSPADSGDVTSAQYEQWKLELSNWGRWGEDDEIGALNLITPEKILEAAALVELSVSLLDFNEHQEKIEDE